jgi:hypothetical protein
LKGATCAPVTAEAPQRKAIVANVGRVMSWLLGEGKIV